MRSRPLAVCALALAATALVACGDDDGAAPSATSALTSTVPDGVAPERRAEGDPTAPPPGRAQLVLGSSLDVQLDVTECRVDLGAEPDGQVPAELVAVNAAGATADGTSIRLEVQRFLSAGAADTITDTVTVLVGAEDQPERVLVAQRFEVAGRVTDGRDPEADDPLLRVAAGAITASGIFAPPGAFAGEPGAVEGAVAVTCP